VVTGLGSTTRAARSSTRASATLGRAALGRCWRSGTTGAFGSALYICSLDTFVPRIIAIGSMSMTDLLLPPLKFYTGTVTHFSVPVKNSAGFSSGDG
jgi:hypothetical protein